MAGGEGGGEGGGRGGREEEGQKLCSEIPKSSVESHKCIYYSIVSEKLNVTQKHRCIPHNSVHVTHDTGCITIR